MIIRGMLRLTIVLFAIMLVESTLALMIGRFMPAEILTTFQSAGWTQSGYSRTLNTFLLIDLSRHIRVQIPSPIDGEIDTAIVGSNGQDVFIQTTPSDKHLYHYNLITDTLRELNSTYTNPETGSVYQVSGISLWSGDESWDYNPEDGAVYHFDLAANTIDYVVTLFDENTPSSDGLNVNRYLMRSYSGNQMALIDRQTIYVFNTDGSNLRRYPNPVDADFSYGNWSWWDERYLYIYGPPTSISSMTSLRILDVNSGEIVPTTQDLEGYSFAPCEHWIAYTVAQYEGQLLNPQTGETQSLSTIPEFVGQHIGQISWLNGCDWLMITIGGVNNNGGQGFFHQPLYIVSRDGQTMYSLGERVTILSSWTWGSDNFLLGEQQGTEEIVYSIYFDGVVHKTLLGHFALTGDWVSPLQSDPYRLALPDYQTNQLSVVNLHTGVIETYFASHEVMRSYPVLWLWN